MKEIKFRARRIDGTFIGYTRFVKGHWECTPSSSVDSNDAPADLHWVAGTLAADIMEQYIGPRDKNGVEIYEGDIVKLTFHTGVVTGVVTYEHSAFRINGFIYRSDEFEVYSEVIGGIYENPELVEANHGK